MYDSILVRCPNCGNAVEFKSKAGGGMLQTYRVPAVPIAIARDVDGRSEECSKCKHSVSLTMPYTDTIELFVS